MANPVDLPSSDARQQVNTGQTIRRNMRTIQRLAYITNAVPHRSTTQPSPAKASGGSRHPSQSQTRTTVDSAIQSELADARFQSEDLADQMFGHLVSTKLAKDILTQFIDDHVVIVYEGKFSDDPPSSPPLDADSVGARHALEQAFQDATEQGCSHPNMHSDPLDTHSPPHAKSKTMYSWKWAHFPSGTIGEDQLVAFLNTIVDKAFHFTKSRLVAPNNELRNRFAAPRDKHHAVPLAYEADSENMRPDFFVLPVEAFSPDFKTVDDTYVNFTALRAVGESKSKDLAHGIEQVQRYARGLRRAQPWVHCVVAMTIAKGRACFSRGDSSGAERRQLALTDGRGCLEFIRILLGLALADHVDLGQNPDVQLKSEVRSCHVPVLPRPSAPSKTAPWRAPISTGQASDVRSSPAVTPSTLRDSPHPSDQPPSTSPPEFSPPNLPSQKTTANTTSRSNKRTLVDHGNEITQLPKPTKQRKVNKTVFLPLSIYAHRSFGTLFTSSSIRGWCTTVFGVVDVEDETKLLALKMSWQDVERVKDQDKVVEMLQRHEGHPNAVIPLKTLRGTKQGSVCTTLGTIRAFLDDQLTGFPVENRILIVNISDLKRPVKFFWSIHDFVRGLRGALLGHQYLTSIGILHRDVSENNIVLALFPGDVHGYIIDLDMAILQEAEKPTERTSTVKQKGRWTARHREQPGGDTTKQADSQPIKAVRTGTTPYMSFNVLYSRRHTHFDDVESFLYVLLLFFFSYAGPLATEELRRAHAEGFVQSAGSGRQSHIRSWPRAYANWAEGDLLLTAYAKSASLHTEDAASRLIDRPEMLECLQKNWNTDLHDAIVTLVAEAWTLFSDSTTRCRDRTEVSHDEFVAILDAWLEDYASLED